MSDLTDLPFDFTKTPFVNGAVGTIPNRLNWRNKMIIERNIDAIKGKRVLDMACSDGRFGFAALRHGAAHVTGVEGRPEQVDRGRAWFEEEGYNSEQFELIVGDAVDYLFQCEPGQFDTIMCLGFFYHTLRQVEVLQELARLKPKTVIMDTTVAPERWYRRPGRFAKRFRPRHLLPWKAAELWRGIEGDEVMFFEVEIASHPSSTIVSNISADRDWKGRETLGGRFKPTNPMMERLFEMHGFDHETLDWHAEGIKDWVGLEDYRDRTRFTYAAKPHGA